MSAATVEDIMDRASEQARRANGHGGAEEAWTAPLPLLDPPPPMPGFPTQALGPWADWCADQAEVVSAPVDFVAMSLLGVAGGVIANTRWGSPWPGWREPPVLNVGLVGLPSSGKSPALATVHEPLRAAERKLAKGFDELHRLWATRKAEAEAVLERWQREVKEAVKLGTPAPRMPESAVVPPEPRPARLFTTDATIEAVADILAHEPKSIALIRDELAGWIGAMDKYGGKGADRAFWLEAYDGRAKVIDRLKYMGKPVRVPHLSVPILGGIQPDRLESMVLAGDDDGLAARICFTCPALVPLVRPTRRPDPDCLTAALLALRRLDMAVNGETGDEYPTTVPFAPAAADALEGFRGRNRQREQDAAGALCGWIGKGPGRVVRIACILEHLWWAASWQAQAAGPPALIGEAAAVAAIGLVEDYLTPHAERVFEAADGGGAQRQVAKDAETLANWIASREESPTLKDTAQLAPTRRLRDKAKRVAAIDLLAERNWLRKERHEGKTALVLNPKLLVEVVGA